MHFQFILSVILVCFTVACNGQFKIIGVLDTKSETNNGDVKIIRSIDEVDEQFPQNKDITEGRGLTQTINVSEIVDDNKENVNFIKPYEATTNEWKKDFVESTTEGISVNNETIEASNGVEGDRNDGVIVKDSNSEKHSDHDVEVTTSSSTTIGAKAYRKSFQPNIRKFSYIEARSFHHPDSSNHLTPSSRWNNYKFIKVLKYRNKYKSKCRCERIWNCPKIQISIQRCEPDYFMCCF